MASLYCDIIPILCVTLRLDEGKATVNNKARLSTDFAVFRHKKRSQNVHKEGTKTLGMWFSIPRKITLTCSRSDFSLANIQNLEKART